MLLITISRVHFNNTLGYHSLFFFHLELHQVGIWKAIKETRRKRCRGCFRKASIGTAHILPTPNVEDLRAICAKWHCNYCPLGISYRQLLKKHISFLNKHSTSSTRFHHLIYRLIPYSSSSPSSPF